MSATEARARNRREGLGRTIGGVGVIVGICVAIWIVFFALPVRELLRTRGWEAKTCEIVSSRATARAIVRGLVPGARLTCFVSPRDARDAVIDRAVRADQIAAWTFAWALQLVAGAIVRVCVRSYRG